MENEKPKTQCDGKFWLQRAANKSWRSGGAAAKVAAHES
jgi:hypothetical protein